MSAKFTCSNCHVTFDSAWSDEEAKAEAQANGFDPDTDSVVVCDDCYHQIMAFNQHPVGAPRPEPFDGSAGDLYHPRYGFTLGGY